MGCDSQSAIFLEKNLAYHSKTKHIDVEYHFFREMIVKGKVLLKKVNTFENVAYLLAKLVRIEKFNSCISEMGLAALLDSTLVQCLLKSAKKTTSGGVSRCYLLCSISRCSLTGTRSDWWSSQVEGQ